MYRQHPSPIERIPVSLRIYTQLRLASAFTNDETETWEIVEEAVDQWMRLHGPCTIPGPATGGVQWKRLFLPNGTLLRTVFNGKNYHCMVEADGMNRPRLRSKKYRQQKSRGSAPPWKSRRRVPPMCA